MSKYNYAFGKNHVGPPCGSERILRMGPSTKHSVMLRMVLKRPKIVTKGAADSLEWA